jgi:NTE family protein
VTLHVVKPQVPLPLDPALFGGRISADTLMDMGHRDACAYLAGLPRAGVPLDSRATAMTEPGLGVRIKERLHGELDRLGAVTVELVTEVRDVNVFLADPSIAVPVVAHIDLAEASTRVLACSGEFSLTDHQARYVVWLPDKQPLAELQFVRRFHGWRDAWHAFTTLEASEGNGSTGKPLGVLHASAGDARRVITSLEPTGAHDLHGRAEALTAVGRLFLREARGRRA